MSAAAVPAPDTPWHVRLSLWLGLGSLTGFGAAILTAASFISVPGRVDRLESVNAGQRLDALESWRTDQRALNEMFDVRGRFNVCVTLAVVEKRDPSACVAFLPDRSNYIPQVPTRP